MDMWERVESGSMHLSTGVRPCTCVSMCTPVCLYVCICMDSRQDHWWAVGDEGGQAAVVSVNLCPLQTPAQDSSLTGITNMTPGHATLATVSQLSSSISRSLKNQEPLNTHYYIASRPIANIVWPQWTMISGRVCLGLNAQGCAKKKRDNLLNAK